jgi:hypothetical protein
MPDTIRQRIITSLDARLKTILVANGYQTDVGANIFDWRAEALEESDLPALIYRDTLCNTEISNISSYTHRMTVEIIAVVANDTPMAIIRNIIADIDKAIGVDDRWGNLVVLTERTGDESGVEIDDRKYAGCRLTVVITFRTLGWNDFVQI